ncbi:hypothetical protein BDZ88DRAFT_303701 [Geranomyces variabilis]|nr:hypothetical protein BDZ88DRAFT_303701 [Geranomyces variabilis]
MRGFQSISCLLSALLFARAALCAGLPDPFSLLSGNVVVVHGFGGSQLVNAQNETVWLTEAEATGAQPINIALPIDIVGPTPTGIRPVGFLTNEPWNPFYTDFITKLQSLDTQGQISLHLLYYDFRRENTLASQDLFALLQNIRQTTGHPSLVFAHSMGSVITMHALVSNKVKSDVISGIVFAGGPFNGNIQGVVQQKTSTFPFLLRSSWNFPPFDGQGVVIKGSASDKPVLDFSKPDVWTKNNLSLALATSTPDIATSAQKAAYLQRTLDFATQIRNAQYFSRSIVYPPIVAICSKAHDTPGTVNATRNADGTVEILPQEVNPIPGDGVVAWNSCMPRSRVPYKLVESTAVHMLLLNDFDAVGKAIKVVTK